MLIKLSDTVTQSSYPMQDINVNVTCFNNKQQLMHNNIIIIDPHVANYYNIISTLLLKKVEVCHNSSTIIESQLITEPEQ